MTGGAPCRLQGGWGSSSTDVYSYGNHPLRRVTVMGQVVALVRREKKVEFVGTSPVPQAGERETAR